VTQELLLELPRPTKMEHAPPTSARWVRRFRNHQGKDMHMIRVVFSLLLLLAVFVFQGCGTATYDERMQQRENELKASAGQYGE